jgi:hypothetical protein
MCGMKAVQWIAFKTPGTGNIDSSRLLRPWRFVPHYRKPGIRLERELIHTYPQASRLPKEYRELLSETENRHAKSTDPNQFEIGSAGYEGRLWTKFTTGLSLARS